MLLFVDQQRDSEYPAGALSGPPGWRDAMDAHVREAWGPLSRGIAELVPVQGVPSIDLLLYEAAGPGTALRMRTRGMSDLPMATPRSAGVPNRVELVLNVPDGWEFFTAERRIDLRSWWMGKAFKRVALHPHTHHTWFSHGQTVQLSADGIPLDPSTLFTDVLLIFPFEPAVVLPPFQHGPLKAFFLQTVFLTSAEAELVRRIGYGDAIATFNSNFSFSFKPTRACSVTGTRPAS